MTQPPSRPQGRYQRAVDRVRGRSVWWFVALTLLVALLPLSTPTLVVVYTVVAIAFWVPVLRSSRRSFREGYREDPGSTRQ